jgi:hypothetical protein
MTFAPDLKADDPAHKAVSSPIGATANARVRVAQLLTTSGTLRIGTLDLPKAEPPGQRYDVWLAITSNGWTMQLSGAANSSDVPGEVALSRQASAVVSPTFVAALIPTYGDSGQIVLRWGPYEGVAEMKFVDPPSRVRRVNSENGLPNVGVKRGNFDDTSAHSREQFLAQNTETAIELPNGRRLSASFIRAGSSDRPRSEPALRTSVARGLAVGGPDYSRIASVADGGVVELTESWVPRLKIETPLRFGKVTARTENQVGGFPGVYGMWLKRVGNNWRLVLNNEYDVWGTQHDAKFDVAEIDLTHSDHQPASLPFAVALVPTGPDRGRLVIVWGAHEWAANFVVAGQTAH